MLHKQNSLQDFETSSFLEKYELWVVFHETFFFFFCKLLSSKHDSTWWRQSASKTTTTPLSIAWEFLYTYNLRMIWKYSKQAKRRPTRTLKSLNCMHFAYETSYSWIIYAKRKVVHYWIRSMHTHNILRDVQNPEEKFLSRNFWQYNL